MLIRAAFRYFAICPLVACSGASGGAPLHADGGTLVTSDAGDGTLVETDASADSPGGGCRQQRAEVCNGLDEDCDDRIDEGFDADRDGSWSRAGGCGAFYPETSLDCDDRHAELASRCPWFVNATANGENNGSDWENGFTDLQTALAVAQSGDEIRVAQGRYTPDSATLDRELSFDVAPGVWLRGGFDGISYAGEDHDWMRHPTTLDGDLRGDDAPAFGARADNARHVLRLVARPLSVGKATIEGFVIRGGHADGTYDRESGQGAALYGETGQLVLRNCRITDSDGAGGVFYFAGEELFITGLELVSNRVTLNGAAFVSLAATTLQHSQIRSNQSPAGVGGMAFGVADSIPHATPVLVQDTEFRENSGSGTAGALSVFSFDTVRIERSVFAANRGSYGAGAFIMAPTVEVTDSEFADNVALAGYGGGLAVAHAESFESVAALNELTFEGNAADYGGALHIGELTLRVTASHFVRNVAGIAGGAMTLLGTEAESTNTEFRGNLAGGLGGAWAVTGAAEASCTQCIFNANMARDGQPVPQGLPDGMEASAIWIDAASNVRVTSSAFLAHTFREAVDDTDAEGLIAVQKGSFSAVNSLFWANTPGAVVTRDAGAVATFAHCAFQLPLNGASDVVLETSPFLSELGLDGKVGTEDDDLRLRAGATCIDAGDGSAFAESPALDFGGQPRFVDDPRMPDVGKGPAPQIDIGPHEYQAQSAAP